MLGFLDVSPAPIRTRWPRSPNSLQPLEPLSHVNRNYSMLSVPKSHLTSPSRKPHKYENPHDSYNGPSFLPSPTLNRSTAQPENSFCAGLISVLKREISRSPGTFSLSQSLSVHIPHKPTNYARLIHTFRTDLCKGRVATCACMRMFSVCMASQPGVSAHKSPFHHSLKKVRF